MNNKGGGSQIQHIKHQDVLLMTKQEIANVLATSFEKNSSLENCWPEFQMIQTQQEQKNLDFSSNNKEPYNQPLIGRAFKHS